MTPRGMHMKHGRYSLALSGSKFGALYDEAVAARDLLDLREPIAILEAMVQGAAQRSKELDTPDFREKARELYKGWRNNSDIAESEKACKELGELLDRGADSDRALSKVADNAERLAKRLEEAWKIKLQKRSAISANDLQALFLVWIDICAQETSQEIAARVASRVRLELARRAGERTLDKTQLIEAVEVRHDGPTG